MLVPVVAFPVSAVPVITPLQRAEREAKIDKDRRRPRCDPSDRFEIEDPADAPSGDPAASRSSVSVLSALLDLPRGG
ncbi:MAG: hypothetical protein ACRYGP_24000 [Janthinobacterium lividum]